MLTFVSLALSSVPFSCEIGIDHVLAQHIAHLFTRDTISLFEEKLKSRDVDNDSDHFEVVLLSCNEAS